VPEAAVDEDGDAELGENEIGFAGERAVPPPAGDVGGAHEGDQAKLGVFVTRAANTRHDGGAFFAGEDVGHMIPLSRLGRRKLCRSNGLVDVLYGFGSDAELASSFYFRDTGGVFNFDARIVVDDTES